MNGITLFTTLLKLGLNPEQRYEQDFKDVTNEQWDRLFKISKSQGVLAIVFDAVLRLPIEQQPPKMLKLRWIAALTAIETRFNQQLQYATELADEWTREGINTYVLKGLSLATYYPNPSHRECGDFDCFLAADYERGNIIAEQLGAKVDREYYKHSHIYYKSLLVENHQFCIGVRGSRENKEFESYLRRIIIDEETKYIGDTKLIKPSADFNAMFLISHSMTHFLVEGIKFRHICDWALFIEKEQHNIDWEAFYAWTDKLNYTIFANTLTAIAVQYVGVKIAVDKIKLDARYVHRVLNDMFENDNIFNKGYSMWRVRFLTIKNRLLSIWKFRLIYRRSILGIIIRQIYGFLFEKVPTI